MTKTREAIHDLGNSLAVLSGVGMGLARKDPDNARLKLFNDRIKQATQELKAVRKAIEEKNVHGD